MKTSSETVVRKYVDVAWKTKKGGEAPPKVKPSSSLLSQSNLSSLLALPALRASLLAPAQ